MRRELRPYDRADHKRDSAPNALAEGFRRGRYILPRIVRRFLRRPLTAYAGRPRMMQAVTALATIIGQFHTGGDNFVSRGLGIGEGGGFFLNRAGLAREYEALTEALVRAAITFLIEIGFIERITPKGDLVEVRRPKNAKSPFGYFRAALKAKKDSLGRIRSPLVMYRLGRATRQLFAKTLQPHRVAEVWKIEEPLWSKPSKDFSLNAATGVEGVHTGCCPFDTPGHDPDDPRFHYQRPDPMRDPRSIPRFSQAEQEAAAAELEARRLSPTRLVIGAHLTERLRG